MASSNACAGGNAAQGPFATTATNGTLETGGVTSGGSQARNVAGAEIDNVVGGNGNCVISVEAVSFFNASALVELK